MTVLALPSPGHSDEPLLTKLRSAVRPEFRTEIIRIDPDDPVFARGRCEVGDCSRGAWARSLCSSHYNRWRRHGQPDLATFTATAGPLQLKPSSRLAETFDLRALPEQTRLELAYSIQCRHDDRTVRLMPTMISGLVRLLANSDVQSLLDRSLEQWREAVDAAALSGTGGRTRGQLRYAWRHLHDLNDGADAETEFARDIWRASMLGTPQPATHSRSASTAPPSRGYAPPSNAAPGSGSGRARRSARSASTSERCGTYRSSSPNGAPTCSAPQG